MSRLTSVSLEDLSFGLERVDCEASLLSLGPLLEDYLVFSLSEAFSENDDSVLRSHHEHLVGLRAHLLVCPLVEPAVLCI